ncbi:hypothetical protein [Larkinella terrae]|uniref:Uncharacterized protein n=1 Tax=Larkinella terrae TaxID=2025311 RepID=A0A7K0EMI0_9BACT|nr:hypothetical protein [Larkinella terrae]MRS63063.1 hypothetical protein [Larkinella terrae]
MEKKKRITVYNDLNDPHLEQVQKYARMTPEERWEEYLKMRKLFFELGGTPQKVTPRISVIRPSWM